MKYVLTFLICASAILSYSCKRGAGSMDPFIMDQSRNIMRPENFGIANGRITTGIECNDPFTVRGIWAPPYVSSDFTFRATVSGKSTGRPDYTWRPFFIERSAITDDGLSVKTNTLLMPGRRAFMVSLTLENQGKHKLPVELKFSVDGTLDRMMDDSKWGFSAPQSSTPTAVREISRNSVALEQGDVSICIAASKDIVWAREGNGFILNRIIGPGKKTREFIVFSIGPATDAREECDRLSRSPVPSIHEAVKDYDSRVAGIFQKLPVLESDNPSLVDFYNRSLVTLLMNRWDVPEFKLKPFYSTGSVRGGCVGDYLWNVGECPEILSMYDPAATRVHIRQFLETGVKSGFGFCPILGTMLHPDYFYPINQEKILQLTYHYVKNTGDIAFLSEPIGNGTIMDSIISEAMFMDDLSKPVALIDYNTCDPQHKGGLSHLELRTPVGKLNYTNVMPDLNGRRYLNYILAARLAELAGKPRPDLPERARALKEELKKQLWDPGRKWFAYQMPDARPPIREFRYTVQMYYMLGSGVLDEEEASGLLSHLNGDEFLSEFGLHSLAKHDPAYFQPDVDNGGPGSCTCFPLNIAKTLYQMDKQQAADDIMKRILWWGERMPYWGDSFYADTMRYREETPLQSTIDAITGAQCIIFGMFGISPDFDGSIDIKPYLPSFAKSLSLKGVHLRNLTFDVRVRDGFFSVTCNGKRLEAKSGQRITVGTDGLLSVKE